MDRFFRVLAFLRLTDGEDNRNLSLTNVAVVVSIVKLAGANDVSVAELGVLLTALLAYQWKGLRRDKRDAQKGVAEAVVADLKLGIQTAQDTAAKALATSRR